MVPYDADKVRENVRRADTEDLLDRATAYRVGMEPEALDLIEAELERRGVSAAAVAEHGRRQQGQWLLDADGAARMCSFCRRPAVAEGWAWHRLFRLVPALPRRCRYCAEHRPGGSRA